MSQDKTSSQRVPHDPTKIPAAKPRGEEPARKEPLRESFTRAPDPAKRAEPQNATPPRPAPPPPSPRPLRKLTPAQTAELENLANVRWRSVQDAILRNDPNTDDLRRDLRTCAQEMLEVQNAPRLCSVLGVMLKLGARCERNGDLRAATSIYEEVLSYVPVNAPHDGQRIRGLCLQRMGKMEGGKAGCDKLNESLNLLGEAEDRGSSYLFLGMHQKAQPHLAAKAFDSAFQAFKSMGDQTNAAKAIVHWAGMAAGNEPDQRIEERLDVAVQLLAGKNEPVYEATAYLELGRVRERIGSSSTSRLLPEAARETLTKALTAYVKARALASDQPGLIGQCVEALDGLVKRRFWAA